VPATVEVSEYAKNVANDTPSELCQRLLDAGLIAH
jgi:hypothetical protein